ncbi:D-TA family PLP-dependent enzyme [Aquimarina algicola]|nr:D-TA family PLP-dependent enzyme [Aquimarina algicola]
MNWYRIENESKIDSPSILLYKERLQNNLQKMLHMVDNDTSKLMPHIKTNKMPNVVREMLSLGITQFKASTIAEAEMAAIEGAKSILIAHQLVGPKIQRFIALILAYPDTSFATIVDNKTSILQLQEKAQKLHHAIPVFIDINTGMNRSGSESKEELLQLIETLQASKNLFFKGLHAYDGHLRNKDFQLRKNEIEKGLSGTLHLFDQLRQNNKDIQLVCGGTPSFTTHLDHKERICSPGTCVFWDWGYDEKLKEQEFLFALLLITRVISKPTKDIITIDLGHKSVAAENPVQSRVKFLNLDDYELLSQSEEHGVLKVKSWEKIQVGDVLYGVPYHVCPTVNLYDNVNVICDQKYTHQWEITARKRKINI